MTNVKEIWKDVPGYEGYYQASTLGKIRSLERWKSNHTKLQLVPARVLKPVLHKTGYYAVSLRKNDPIKTHYVHRLVLLTFLGTSELKYCDHINEIKTDNRLVNLRYCTNRENALFHFGQRNDFIGTVRTRNNTWRAQIFVDGKRHHLGTRKTRVEAANLYKEALSKVHNLTKVDQSLQ